MLDSDPTLRSERQLQRFLRKLEASGFLTTTVTRIFIHLVHHPIVSFRPIVSSVSSIGTFNYRLVKFLCNLVSPVICSDHSIQD